MAMRFAYLSLEANRSICPIIIDDGWLHYDHQRKYQLAELLAKFGEKYQIICFSSDKEMVSYYHEMNQIVKQLEGANNEKIRDLVIDEQFEQFVLIKSADVRIAKNGKNLLLLLSKILQVLSMVNTGMLRRRKSINLQPAQSFF